MLVSSAIVVVITRVTPSMLPPTIMTAPTSAIARPNPASNTVASEKRVSHSSVNTARMVRAPSEISCSRYSPHASATICRDSAAMIGVMRMVCAMIIAVGVNRIPSAPNGPARDSSKYTTSPTTTGGNPIIALSSTVSVCRPGKRPTAIAAPSGRPRHAANSVAVRLTRSDSSTIASSFGSKCVTSEPATARLSEKVFIGLPIVQSVHYDCIYMQFVHEHPEIVPAASSV